MLGASHSLLLLLAAVCFTAGGVYMKYSQGLTQIGPSILVGVLFLIGAAFQALAMRGEDMSVVYVFVLGLECVLAFAVGVMIFGEAVTTMRVAAVALITIGMAMLRW